MTTGRDSIGVAVVGLGVGEQHARAYLANGRCQLRWLYDLDVEKAQKIATVLGSGRVATSFKQVLDDPEVQAVSIASYDDAHFEQVVAALNAGKHVFVEKPLSRTVEELATVKRAWSNHQGKLKLSSNLVLRAAPIYRWLKKKIEHGDLGHIYAYDGEYLYGRLHKITHGWRKDVDGYSVMEGGGVHLIDLMVWLTGERPVSVHAVGNRISTEETAFRYKDYVAATFLCASGLVARIVANFGSVHRHQHVVRVFATNGTFLYDDAGPRYHTSRDPAVAACAVDLPTLPAAKGDLIGPFVSAILQDKDMNAHTQEVFDVISLCAASDDALASGSTAAVQYV